METKEEKLQKEIDEMRKKLDHIHKEKGENLHLRQQLEHNNKIIEQLQKSTKTVYVAKEKPFTNYAVDPQKIKIR
jgi:heterodisulfide reductase subunit B